VQSQHRGKQAIKPAPSVLVLASSPVMRPGFYIPIGFPPKTGKVFENPDKK
jgi:hypothetical protein